MLSKQISYVESAEESVGGEKEEEYAKTSKYAEGLEGNEGGGSREEESHHVGESGDSDGWTSMFESIHKSFFSWQVGVSLIHCIHHHEHVISTNPYQQEW